jgi:hypothetical protein
MVLSRDGVSDVLILDLMLDGKDISEALKSGFPCVEKATIEREESGNCTYGEKKSSL